MVNRFGLKRIQLKSNLTDTRKKTGNCQIKSELLQIIIVVTIVFIFYFFRLFKKRNLERDYDVYFFRDLKQRNLERDYQEQEQLRQKIEREKEQVHQEQERQERKRKEREKQEREEKVRLEEERRERQRQRQKQSSQKREPPKNRNEKERSYEEILGLSSGWTKSDLISAYRKKCQQTHPDKWKGYPDNIVRAMEKEYKEVQNTFKYLSKKQRFFC